MRKRFFKKLKFCLRLLYYVSLFSIMIMFFISTVFANQKDESQATAQTQTKNSLFYSFQPLLIQGKKRLIQKTKDMKVESDSIVESELFFVNIDFQKRIFEGEVME